MRCRPASRFRASACWKIRRSFSRCRHRSGGLWSLRLFRWFSRRRCGPRLLAVSASRRFLIFGFIGWFLFFTGVFGRGFNDFFDAAFHVKAAFWEVVVFAFENFFEAANGIGDLHLLAFGAGEHLGDAKRLAEETLNLARAK